MIEDNAVEAHRVQAISAMADSPGWDYFAKEVKEKLDRLLHSVLAGRSQMSDASLRANLGEAAVLQWVLTWPQSQIRDFNLAVDEEIVKVREDAEEAERREQTLDYGHHSPFSLENPEE